MTDDIYELVNQVVQESEQDRRQKMIENYISRYAAKVQLSTEVDFTLVTPDPQIAEEIGSWQKANKLNFAYKIAEAARILLRRELLGE